MDFDLWAGLERLIGAGKEDLNALEMAVRAAIIYVIALSLIRLGATRFMGKNTALDLILGFVLGSVLSRAITGNAPFLPTIVAGGVLVGMHTLLAVVSFHWRPFGRIVKGYEHVLVREGEVLWDNMRRSHIAVHDLEHALYTSGKVTDVKDVQIARLERNGEISVIPRRRPSEPRVVEITVRDGVQTVRVELG
jgi:uncharacterized membrane protein YcaP (DUF421 family)